MTQKKTLVLLAFSLCLNAGFLITALGRTGMPEKTDAHPPMRAYAHRLEILKGLGLTAPTFQQAKELLDDFMTQRTELVVRKLDHKLETLALLQKTPGLSRQTLEMRQLEEDRFEKAIDTLGLEHTLQMRQLLPPDKMALMYGRAEALIRGHRDNMVHWKESIH